VGSGGRASPPGSHPDGEATAIKILFVCTANICRSPTAEGVFRRMVDRAGLGADFIIDSAGIFHGRVGEAPSRLAAKTAARRGYNIKGHRARQISAADIVRFDLIMAMTRRHLDELCSITPPGLTHRLYLLTAFGPPTTAVDIPDPYGGPARDYERALDLIEAGCRGLLESLMPPELSTNAFR
jgi:protein-tyrosine phosphatase